MSWQPLVTGDRSAQIAAIVREVVAAIDATEPRGAYDLADRALMHAYAAEQDVAPDVEDRGGDALVAAVTGFASSQSRPALFGGAAGVGWRVAHVTAEEDAALVCGKIDVQLARLTANEPVYDLISGVVGFGVYALARGEAGRPIASAVMDRLAAMARPRRGGLALHTPPELLPAWQRAEAPDGYWNFGVAHGMPGVAAMLARFVAAGVEAERAGVLLDGIMQCLLAIEPTATGEKYPSWLAGRAEDELGAIPDQERRGRLAWCYGDLGASLALFSVAQATGNAMWRDEALALARVCAARSDAKAQLRDTAICHGALGVAHQFNRLWQATGDEGFAAAARHWLDRGLAMRRDHPIAGFPSCLFEDGVENWVADGTLLSGAAGVALILHAMITTTEPAWDRLLLIDVEPMTGDR
jgi:hypothetical protein